MTIENSDLFIVGRGDESYKITYEQLKEEIGPIAPPDVAPIIGSVTLSEETPGTSDRFTSQEFTTTVVMAEDGDPASIKGIQGWVEGRLTTQLLTDTIIDIQTQEIDNSVTCVPLDNNPATGDPTVDIPNMLLGLESGRYNHEDDTVSKLVTFTTPILVTSDMTMLTGNPGDINTANPPCTLLFTVNFTDSTSVVFDTLPHINNNATDPKNLLITDTNHLEQSPYGGPVNVYTKPHSLAPYAGKYIASVGIGPNGPSTFSGESNFYLLKNYNDRLGVSPATAQSIAGVPFSVLEFNSALNLSLFSPGEVIQQSDGNAEGVVDHIDYVGDNAGSTKNQIITNTYEGAWALGQTVDAGEKTVDNAKLYLELGPSLNVTDLVSSPTEHTFFSGTEAKIKFPATLNGQAPDDILPDLTTIRTNVEAVNSSGTVNKTSNVVQPSFSCTSGPIETDEITAVDTTTSPIYSNNVTLSAGSWLRTPDLAFDGATSNNCASGVGESFTITFNPVITNVTKLEVWLTSNATGAWGVSGTGITTTTVNGPNGDSWNEVPCGNTLTDLTIAVSQQSSTNNLRSHLAAVRVNGSVLIDGQSETTLTFASDKDLDKLKVGDAVRQENSVTFDVVSDGTVEGKGGNVLANAFDGDCATQYEPGGTHLEFININATSIGITTTSTVTIKPAASAQDPATIFVYDESDNQVGTVVATSTADTVINLTGAPLKVGRIRVERATGCGVFCVKFDGTILTRTGSGTVGSVDTVANTMTLATSNGTWGPANQNHYAIGPDYTCPIVRLDANNPEDVDTFTAIKNTLDGYIIDSARRQEVLDALLSADLSDALLLANLAQISTRLSDLEADEIGDDAVSSALLTLIANINQRLTALENN